VPATPLAAAILAGGLGRRFDGRDKSRLVVRGQPIIVRQVDVLQRLTPDVFVVARDRARFADLGLPVHLDLVEGAGALGGIYTALEATSADRVLVVAGDLPFLSEALLRELAARAGDHDGAWVDTARGAEPLLACYRRHAAARIRAALDAGDFKAAHLDRYLRMASIDETALARFGPIDELLANVNTPEDYARIQ